jgi:UPF0716 protein FxsA
MVKWFIIAILLLPLAEIATFVAVALLIGWTWAFVLMLATTAAGFLVLKKGGRGRFAGLGRMAADPRTAATEAHAGSFLAILGGILLLLPGFLTDIVGALLLLPRVRRSVAARFRSIMPSEPNDRTVIDLERDEWQRMPDPKKRRTRRRLDHQ